ncbi:MAG: rod shape-determining protein MreC [Limnohabitans sp.]
MLAKLLLLGLLSALLMVADHRLRISQPLRASVSLLVTPLQWLILQPGQLVDAASQYLGHLDEVQDQTRALQSRTIAQAQRLQEVEQLRQENQQLRQLLGLHNPSMRSSRAVEILYETADPYSQQVVIDKGLLAGITQGSAVINVSGVVGQVTRVYPLVSEVTLLTDRNQSIPVMNVRTGARYIAFGESAGGNPLLELRFVPASADLKEGDLLTTNGLDDTYPAGLHVGRIAHVDRRIDNSFARVSVTPSAQRYGRHLLVLKPDKDRPLHRGDPGQATPETPVASMGGHS